MADSLQTWQELACPCGGTRFTQRHSLRRSASGGLVPTAVGWECTGCHLAADVQQMLGSAEIRRLQQQIQEQQAQLDAATPDPGRGQAPPPACAGVTTSAPGVTGDSAPSSTTSS